MHERGKERRVAACRRACRENGLPFTPQRRAVLEAVLDLGEHPTADQVFELVAGRLPGISRTTVYRALEKLVAIGVINKVSHAGRAVRYDRRIEMHHHLLCLRCDQVFDFCDSHLDAIPIPDTSAIGFEARDHRVQILGVCRNCRDQEGKP